MNWAEAVVAVFAIIWGALIVRYRDFFTRLMLEQLRLLFGYGFRQFTGEGGAKTLVLVSGIGLMVVGIAFLVDAVHVP